MQGGRATVRLYDPLVPAGLPLDYRSNPGAPFAEEAMATERTPRYTHQTGPDRAGLETGQPPQDRARRGGDEDGVFVFR